MASSSKYDKSLTNLSASVFLLPLLSFLCAAQVAQSGTVLYDTTDDRNGPLFLIGRDSDFIDIFSQPAGSFVVTGGDFLLESLTLDLQKVTNESGGSPGNYEIRIWDNNVTLPGNLLESISVLDSGSLREFTTATSTARPLLSDGETYWVSVALPDDASEGRWRLTRSVDLTRRNNATAFSRDVSATWFPSSLARSFLFKVIGTPVPEPNTIVLVAVCLLSLCCAKRKRVESKNSTE